MSNKRTSKFGVMYDDKQSKANLDKIVYNIKAEVEFNILTGNVLPFEINEELPESLTHNDCWYIINSLKEYGIVLSASKTEVVDLL